jgi:protein-tyrosine-phosphatase
VTTDPTVLFVCVRNSGKSQMAAGLMRQAAGEKVLALSAGTDPGTKLNALSVAALADACPVYPGRRYEDWDLPDLRDDMKMSAIWPADTTTVSAAGDTRCQ